MEFFLFYKKYHIVHTLSSEIKANVQKALVKKMLDPSCLYRLFITFLNTDLVL